MTNKKDYQSSNAVEATINSFEAFRIEGTNSNRHIICNAFDYEETDKLYATAYEGVRDDKLLELICDAQLIKTLIDANTLVSANAYKDDKHRIDIDVNNLVVNYPWIYALGVGDIYFYVRNHTVAKAVLEVFKQKYDCLNPIHYDEVKDKYMPRQIPESLLTKSYACTMNNPKGDGKYEDRIFIYNVLINNYNAKYLKFCGLLDEQSPYVNSVDINDDYISYDVCFGKLFRDIPELFIGFLYEVSRDSEYYYSPGTADLHNVYRSMFEDICPYNFYNYGEIKYITDDYYDFKFDFD